MRKRQVKKFAKNARKNSTPYRKARRKGSKKDVRRNRAFNKLSREIEKEHSFRLIELRKLSNQLNPPKGQFEKLPTDKLEKLKNLVSTKLKEEEEYENQKLRMKQLQKDVKKVLGLFSAYQEKVNWLGAVNDSK